MKIYIVGSEDWDGLLIEEAFTSREKAEAFRQEIIAEKPYMAYLQIIEVEVVE
jgi:hypothetical protein